MAKKKPLVEVAHAGDRKKYAELLKKIEYIQNRPLSTAIAGCVARKKEVLSLPAYSWIRYTRIDQFHNEAVLKYASSPCVCVGNLDSHPCP